jgi:hypothetical protein
MEYALVEVVNPLNQAVNNGENMTGGNMHPPNRLRLVFWYTQAQFRELTRRSFAPRGLALDRLAITETCLREHVSSHMASDLCQATLIEPHEQRDQGTNLHQQKGISIYEVR